MTKPFRIRFFGSQSHNRKSKTCTEFFDSAQDKLRRSFLKRPRRRKWVGIFTIGFTFVVGGVVAQAQQTGKILRIGYLDSSTASGSAVLVDAFRQEMRKLGWIEGKNITIEYRFAEQKSERVPELAADLVRLKVDLIVVSGTPVALAAKSATTTIPIVMTSAGDPVAAGLVASLARPGGNVTGLSGLGTELNTKRAGGTQGRDSQARPSWISAVAGSSSISLQLKELRPAALALKLKLEEIETQPDAQRFRERLSNRKAETGGRDYDDQPLAPFSPKESGSSSLPSNTGCRLFTHRRNMSMRAVSCPTGRTTMTSIGAPRFTWTRS